MADTMNRILIVDVPNGGSLLGGQEVYFQAVAENGASQNFSLRHEQFGMFVVGLLRFGAVAKADREKNNPNEAGQLVSFPNPLCELNVGVTSDGKLILQVRTDQGFDLEFVVPLDIAKQLSSGLPQVVADVESGKRPNPSSH